MRRKIQQIQNTRLEEEEIAFAVDCFYFRDEVEN